MALILGFGDMFHLIPRIAGHIAGDVNSFPIYLGLGKLITSITMSVFYYLLLRNVEDRFKKTSFTHWFIISLLIIKVLSAALPYNNWFTNDVSYQFSIIRNIPFLIMGFYLIFIMYKYAIGANDKAYKKIATGILLSFLFYIPVIFVAPFVAPVGALMMPKTIAYLYVIIVAYKEV